MVTSSGARVAFLSQGMASGGSFLLSVLLVRALGLESFGVLSLALIGVTYAAGIGQALVCQPLLSLAPAVEGDERRTRVREALWMAVGLAALVAATVALVLGWLEAYDAGLNEWGVWTLPVAGLAGLRVLAPAFRGALFTLRQGRATVAMDALGSWGPCAGVLGLEFFGEVSVASSLAVLTVSTGSACALALVALRGLGAGAAPGPEALARHWRSGRWLAGNQVLSWFGTGGIHAATAALVGPVGVGAIRAAQSLVGVLLVGTQALELWLPGKAAVALGRGGPGALARWSRVQAGRFTLGFATLGAGLWLTGPVWIRLLFPGVDPDLTAAALGGLAGLPAASVLALLLQVSFRALENTRPVFAAYAVSAVVSAAVAVPLVQAFGLAGAAWGLTGTQGLFALLLMASLPRHRDQGSTGIERSVSIRHS